MTYRWVGRTKTTGLNPKVWTTGIRKSYKINFVCWKFLNRPLILHVYTSSNSDQAKFSPYKHMMNNCLIKDCFRAVDTSAFL